MKPPLYLHALTLETKRGDEEAREREQPSPSRERAGAAGWGLSLGRCGYSDGHLPPRRHRAARQTALLPKSWGGPRRQPPPGPSRYPPGAGESQPAAGLPRRKWSGRREKCYPESCCDRC